MKNRPTEPGLYWWEDDYGKKHVAEIDHRMLIEYDVCGNGELDETNIEEFEYAINFQRWIGKAFPPKSLTRYDMCRGDGIDYPRQYMDECRSGDYVSYFDVIDYEAKDNEE